MAIQERCRLATTLLVVAFTSTVVACGPIEDRSGEQAAAPDAVATGAPPESAEPSEIAAAPDEVATSAAPDAAGGQLSTFVSADPGTLDPALLSSYDQTLVATNVLEGLYRLTPDGTEVEPALAESVEIGGDGLEMAITLRDASFHDGTPVTAADVKFSFERVAAPETRSPKAAIVDVIEGAAALRDGSAQEISGIEVVSDSELLITLAEPYSSFEAMLASPTLAIVPQAAVEAAGEDFGSQVVAAGPFALDEWQRDQQLTAVAFDDYWDGRPAVDQVTWRVVPDESTRMVEFEAGGMDIAWLPPASFSRYAGDPQWEDHIQRADTIHTEFLAVNLEREPLGTSLELRRAICQAVDRAAVVASLQDRATEAGSLLPDPLAGGAERTPACSSDVEGARALVAQSGLGDRSLTLISPPWENLTQTLQLYQANLAEVGVTVELEPLEFGQYQERLDAGDFDLAWGYRVPDFLSADDFLSPLLSSERIGSGNAARYADPETDQLLAQARAESDEDARTDLYEQLWDTVREQLPYIPLVHNVYVDVSQQDVENYVPSAMDAHNYRSVQMSGA